MKAFNKLTLACIIGISTLLTACGGDKSAEQKTDSSQNTSNTASDKLETKFVTIGTGGASGPYNIIGTSLAEGYASQFGANAKTQTTGASVENLNLLDQKKLEMAFVMSDALNEAVSGTGNFKTPLTSVSQIATLYPTMCRLLPHKPRELKALKICVANVSLLAPKAQA
ncbi:TRAP transporter solute receptor, TAXI family [Moraxella caprae]|uniref:TRAP transporter solute receptor, TAXI family n=1 Tax=Moraxella caprae TaxID=90240 RepID=A0A378R0T5_9GAMM|nr:TRAP transporter solute receptor, TAXI family [Moraxella caprae]